MQSSFLLQMVDSSFYIYDRGQRFNSGSVFLFNGLKAKSRDQSVFCQPKLLKMLDISSLILVSVCVLFVVLVLHNQLWVSWYQHPVKGQIEIPFLHGHSVCTVSIYLLVQIPVCSYIVSYISLASIPPVAVGRMTDSHSGQH